MKTTRRGYRVSKNGSIITSTEKDSYKTREFLGETIKLKGTYYTFNRKQGIHFIYLPL